MGRFIVGELRLQKNEEHGDDFSPLRLVDALYSISNTLPKR